MKFKELVARVRKIDKDAAEYLEGDRENDGIDWAVDDENDKLDNIMIWECTPQGHNYWSNIHDQMNKETI